MISILEGGYGSLVTDDINKKQTNIYKREFHTRHKNRDGNTAAVNNASSNAELNTSSSSTSNSESNVSIAYVHIFINMYYFIYFL